MSETKLTIKYTQTGYDNVAGVLYDENGNDIFSHVSSSLSYLKTDLTTGSKERLDYLSSRYPDGYYVEMVDSSKPFITDSNGGRWSFIRPPVPLGEYKTPDHFVLQRLDDEV